MQKWEIRYALLLLLVLVFGLLSAFPVKYVLTDENCKKCQNNCTQGYFIEELDPETGQCKRCSCLGTDKSTAAMFRKYTTSYLENVAFLSSTERLYQIGQQVEFTCVRWYNETTVKTKLHRNYIRRRNEASLPEVGQQRWYVAKFKTLVVSIVNATTVVDASTMTDDLECRRNSSVCDEYCSSIPLFPSKVVQPVITGPKVVKPEEKASWTCTVDFMPIRSEERELDFAMEVVQPGYLHMIRKGPQLEKAEFEGVHGKKLTVFLELAIPPRLVKTDFDVQCASIQRFTGETNKSELYTVRVPESTVVKDITTQMTTLGGVFGALAVLILCAFLAIYCNRKLAKWDSQAKAAKAAEVKEESKKPAAEPAPKEQKPAGILKPALKSALKAPAGSPVDGSRIAINIQEPSNASPPEQDMESTVDTPDSKTGNLEKKGSKNSGAAKGS